MGGRSEEGHRYVVDSSRRDRDRLIRVAHQRAPEVRDACRRAGLGPGNTAIDVGCGPLGALPVLAELVGPAGVVVGTDVNLDALQHARAIMESEGHAHVSLIQADLSTADASLFCPPGPFDLAFCRLFLIHQADPEEATLRTVARLVRPGGHIIVQDLVNDPRYPTFDPPVPAAGRAWELVYDAMRRRGASPDAARHLGAACAQVGLHPISQRGYFYIGEPHVSLESIHDILVGARRSIIRYGVGTEREIEELLRSLRDAQTRTFRSHFGTLYAELIAGVPPVETGAA